MTSGLVAYLDGEPVRWCAVEPRTAYPRLLRNTRVAWDGRGEDKNGDSVHSVFADAGFTEVSRPTVRRVVMRIDF